MEGFPPAGVRFEPESAQGQILFPPYKPNAIDPA